MPAYRVMINGQNLLVEMEGRVATYGFFMTRLVEGTDSVATEHAAVNPTTPKEVGQTGTSRQIRLNGAIR